MPGESRDVLSILTDDHRALQELFGQVEALEGADDDQAASRRHALFERVVIELSRHSAAEEAEVYPAVRKKINPELAERALQDHVDAERTMKQLTEMSPDDPHYAEDMSSLFNDVREHIADEEATLFPLIRAALTPDELAKLGRKVQLLERVAPTRPHTFSPKRSPENKLLGPLTGMLDRLRDALGNRGSGA